MRELARKYKEWRCRRGHRGSQHFLFLSRGYAPPWFMTEDGQWTADPSKLKDYGSCAAARQALDDLHASARAKLRELVSV